MLAVIGYFSGDRHQAVRLAAWIAELGGCKGHRLLVLRDKSAPRIETFAASFDGIEEIVVTDDVWKRWPESCNNVFKKAAKHIQYTNPKPWLWLEPDVIPMHAGWLDEIAAEYAAAGQPFLGDLVSVHTPELDVEDHMSGVAVYPGKMTDYAGAAVMQVEMAWDVAAAEQILPQMAISELIHHAWKHPTFENMEQVQREILAIKPKCALFHASKDGSLIEILRSANNLPVPVLAEEIPSVKESGAEARESTSRLGRPQANADSRGGQLICDILIKSYPQDYELFGYCTRSIEKFAKGFRRLVVIYPSGAEEPALPALIRYSIPVVMMPTVENGEGYLVQQCFKASAHEFTDADYVLHLDSDCILTKPITPETFLRDGKPLWLMTPWAQTQTPWQPITEKFIGEPVEFEFMRRFPFLIPRKLHLAISAFALAHHGQRLTDYILSQPHRSFSEFNALGALAYSRARDEFSWLDTTKEELPEPVLIQRHSHDPLTDETRDAYENILNGGAEKSDSHHSETSDPSGQSADVRSGCGVPPVQEVVPWADRAESEAEIKRLCLALRAFQTAPVYTNRVRLELKAFEVIPGGSKIKGMKKRRSRLG